MIIYHSDQWTLNIYLLIILLPNNRQIYLIIKEMHNQDLLQQQTEYVILYISMKQVYKNYHKHKLK